MAFKLFRHKGTDIVKPYPEHYANHPVFGKKLEAYEPELEEFEEEKVVVETHELPLEQRISIKATSKEAVEVNDKENDSGWN